MKYQIVKKYGHYGLRRRRWFFWQYLHLFRYDWHLSSQGYIRYPLNSIEEALKRLIEHHEEASTEKVLKVEIIEEINF